MEKFTVELTRVQAMELRLHAEEIARNYNGKYSNDLSDEMGKFNETPDLFDWIYKQGKFKQDKKTN